jgi:uncharacterized protein YqgC (DUF456 family)
MTATEVAIAVAILVGLVGILVPVLPGSVLILGAVVVWALEVQEPAAWVAAAAATVVLTAGAVV